MVAAAPPQRVAEVVVGILLGTAVFGVATFFLVEWATATGARPPRPAAAARGDRRRAGEATLKANSIGAVEAAAQSFGMMSPIMALCLMTPLIATGAGFATPAAIAVAALGSMACGRTVAKFAALPAANGAGSLLAYTQLSLGPSWGLYCGIVYTSATALLTVGGMAFLAQFAAVNFASYHFLSALVLVWVLCVAVVCVSIFGVRVSTRTQLGVTVVSAALVLVLGFVIIASRATSTSALMLKKGDHHTTTAFPGLASRIGASLWPFTTAPSGGGFFQGVMYSLLIFAGYESATALGEETAQATQTLPSAVLLTVLLCGVFYCWCSITLALGYDTAAEWASDSAALTTLASKFMGPFASSLLFLAVLFDGWAGSVSTVNLVSRLMLTLARGGVLPAALARVHPRFQTPANAVLTVGALTVTVTSASVLVFGSDMQDVFTFAVDAGGVLIQTSYLLVMVAGAVHFASWQDAVAALVPAAAILGSIHLSPGYIAAFLLLVGAAVAVLAVRELSPQTLDVMTRNQGDGNGGYSSGGGGGGGSINARGGVHRPSMSEERKRMYDRIGGRRAGESVSRMLGYSSTDIDVEEEDNEDEEAPLLG